MRPVSKWRHLNYHHLWIHFKSYSWWPNLSVQINFHWWKSWTSRRWLIAGQTSPIAFSWRLCVLTRSILSVSAQFNKLAEDTLVPFSQIFDQNHFILASFWLKLRFLWPWVLEWTFPKCWRGVVDLKGIPNVWTQRNERGDGTNDKWQTFVWRKNLRIPF